MRTLKKTLALVLCLAMMVGLCAFGASAKDFTDAEEIEYAEEVALLTGIGVIDGIPVGDEFKFDPTGILTREQACKIITTMLGYGEIAPKAAPFTDVPADKWSAGYIATCAGLGIVAGRGDGTFDPTGKLTAEAWQKMLLCALGYDAEAEELVGASWEVGVAKLVKKTNLSDDITLSPIAEVTREQACKLAYNALTVPEVEYNGGTHVSTSDGTKVDVNNPARATGTCIAQNFGLAVNGIFANGPTDKQDFDDAGGPGAQTVFEGIITQNGSNADVKTTTIRYTDDATYAGGVAVAAANFNIETGADLLGHYVRIYCGTKTVAGKLPVYSLTDLSKVVTIAAGAGFAGDADKFGATFGATAADIPAAEYVTFPSGGVGAGVTGTASTAAGNSAVATVTYVLNQRNKIVSEMKADYATVTLERVTKVVTTADNETITLTNYGPINNGKKVAGAAQDLVREYDGIAEKDIVVCTKMGTIYNLAKAETVTGKISAIGTAAPNVDAITLDGTVYKHNTAADNTGTLTDVVLGTVDKAAMKANTYTLYLDGNGKYITCVLAEGENTATGPLYVTKLIKKTELSDNGDQVKFYAVTVDGNGKTENILIGIEGVPGGVTSVAGGTDVDTTTGGVQTFPAFFTFDTSATAALAALGVKDATTVAQGGAPAAITDRVWSQTAAASVALKATDKSVTLTAGKGFLTADTVYIFIDATTGEIKTKTGGVNMTVEDNTNPGPAPEAFFVCGWDNATDKNLTVKSVYILDKYADEGADASTLLYVPAVTSPKQTTDTGFVFSVYDAVTGEKKDVTANASTALAAGFHKYTIDEKGIYHITAAAEGNGGTAPYAGIQCGFAFEGKHGTGILAGTAGVLPYDYAIDVDAAEVKVIDTRSATTVTTDAVGALSDVAALASVNKAEMDAGGARTIKIDLYIVKGAATIIFVKSFD